MARTNGDELEKDENVLRFEMQTHISILFVIRERYKRSVMKTAGDDGDRIVGDGIDKAVFV